VQTFVTAREAKEFLISRIITEAQREGVPLSELETKMLYFSETAWTLPDIMEVSEAFDRDYDEAEYEQKIGTIIRNFCTKARKENRDEFNTWTEAVRTIRPEDHYLLVLIDAPRGAGGNSGSRFLKLLLIGLAIVVVVLAIGYLILSR
jgi:hypothetical protein